MHPLSLFLTRRSLISAPFARLSSLVLRTQDARNAELANPKTHFNLRPYASREAWQSRRRELRNQILGAAGLLPFPAHEPVQAHTVKRARHDDYVTEAILLETLPGYFVGGTIYRPLDSTQRWPGVLLPHGHWKHGRVENLPSYSVPALGVNLALQGYVAFSWDMVGYNDTRQTSHDFGGWREQLWGFSPLGLQLWNSLRATEYMLSRPDVDGGQLACTGASGGATQTILLSAVEDRITCSAPVNMISSIYQGADPCEEAPNLRLGTNNVEIAALMAPRPMLMVSCTGDWTRNTPKIEYPAVRSVYSLFDRADVLENAHFEADHNYDRNTREAVYRFLARHMQPRADPGLIAERELGEMRAEELLARTPEIAPPVGELNFDRLFQEWIANARRQTATVSASAANRIAIRSALMCEWPERVESSTHGEKLFLSRTGANDRVPAVWLRGRGAASVVIHQDGMAAALDSPEAKRLRAASRPVLTIDAFQTGTARALRERGGRWFLSYNQTDDANRVQDILTALSWLRTQTRDEPELIGLGRAALWVIFAGAVSRFPMSVVADLSEYEGLDEEMRDHFFVPCIQRAGGLKTAAQLNRKLRAKL